MYNQALFPLFILIRAQVKPCGLLLWYFIVDKEFHYVTHENGSSELIGLWKGFFFLFIFIIRFISFFSVNLVISGSIIWRCKIKLMTNASTCWGNYEKTRTNIFLNFDQVHLGFLLLILILRWIIRTFYSECEESYTWFI